MGRVLLVNPHVGFTLQDYQARPRIPNAILYVGTALANAGREVVLVDQVVSRDWRGRVEAAIAAGVDYVGLTTMTGTQILNAVEIAALVRSLTDVPIVWGGIHPTLVPEQTLASDLVDIVVRGEGEATIVELDEALRGARPLGSVRGITYLDGGVATSTPDRPFIDLDAQPIPRYELLDMETYARVRGGYRSVNVATSRGCPFNCGYCFVKAYHHRQWRGMSVDRAIAWIRFLKDTYGFDRFWLDDEEFFIDLGRAREMIGAIARLAVRWKASMRIDSLLRVDDEFLDLLVSSGCHRLTLGVESGSNRMLELMDKRITREQAIEANRRLARVDLHARYNFMIGFPTETIDDVNQTVSLALQLRRENPRAVVSNFAIFTPYPGSDLHGLAVRHGLQVPGRLEDWAQFHRCADNTVWLPAEMRRAARVLAFASPFLNQPVDSAAPLPVKLLGLAYRPLARQRIKRHFYGLPVEIGLARALGLYASD